MEHLQYVIEDSTIAYLLGVNNFTNDESAILELVKNSYDAGALHMNISFSGDQLVIADDGQGMDENNIRTAWMHVGKSDKSYEIFDANNRKRVLAGSKGVGRFALARLGNHVMIQTKKDSNAGFQCRNNLGNRLEFIFHAAGFNKIIRGNYYQNLWIARKVGQKEN